MVHLVSGKVTDTVPDIANQFLVNIFRFHGLPSEIITDRDARFTSQFWKAFYLLLRTKILMNTVFHPQTDG